MRFLMDPRFEQELRARNDHPADCYVRPGEYLHHIYLGGVKYVVAPSLVRCIEEAKAKPDLDALRHLILHMEQLETLLVRHEEKNPGQAPPMMLGDPPPKDEEGVIQKHANDFTPKAAQSPEETGLNRTVLLEAILRAVFNLGRPTGNDIARDMKLNYRVIEPLLKEMRHSELLEVAGQRGAGDPNYEYILKPPRGQRAVEDALKKTMYSGPCPVPFQTYLDAIEKQSIRGMRVTRRNIRSAFADLILNEDVLTEIGPAVNSGSSIFLFGYPGNGKTSVAERITRLMGDEIYVPYAVEVEGQVIKIFDAVVHKVAEVDPAADIDLRWVKIKRPTIIVGGELIMPMLDLNFNEVGRFYEAPIQMKANGGIFMIDDFGRQQVRPIDLLNRWIVPLEKRYDYLTTITGKKLEIPFELLLIFSTNLDPNQLADEAFLRRIKYKIEIRDPDEAQWRRIWNLVCNNKNVKYDSKGVDYLLEKWFKPMNRPMRMCHPRDILDHMINIAKYNLERVSFSPDLIDAACRGYFVSQEKKDFGAKVRLE